MKRIPFLIIVFMLTTGFFKSALEECADESFEYSNSIPSTEYKTVKLSDEHYKKLKDDHEKALKKYYALPICKNSLDATKDTFSPKCRIDPSKKSGFTYEELLGKSFNWELDQAKKVKTKEYSKSEMKKKYKKFFKKSLKTKMNNNKYYENYSSCVAYKKRSPELFEAEYD